MRNIVVGSTIIGAMLLSAPAFAQQKTVAACTKEWQANKDANQAKGITLKAFVTQCRGGAAQTQTAPAAPAQKTTTAAAPAVAATATTAPVATAAKITTTTTTTTTTASSTRLRTRGS